MSAAASGSISAVDAARAALAVAEGAPAVAVVTCIEAGAPVRRMLVDATGSVRGSIGHAVLDDTAMRRGRALLAQPAPAEPVLDSVEVAGHTVLLYVEAHHPPEHMLVVGAGHIAVPLAALGIKLGFRVTVLDDREEFATTERFDDGVVVERVDFATDPFAGVPITDRTYVALVTRGHRWDFDCLQRLVSATTRPRYIGMIGSRRRVRAAFTALLDAGVARSELAAVHAPIGLEINAETPAEIAVAIAAEMIAVRRGAATAGIGARERVLERLLG
jgi:xanthine dehydrogenase accessory factor